MTNAWEFVKIRQFEHVAAGPSVALLRVSGKLPRRRSGSGGRPTLVADDGRSVQRFEAVASPPDGRGILRSAYSVPVETMTPDTVFSLETSEGFVIALPSPAPWAGRLGEPVRSRPAPPTSDPGVTAVAEADEEQRAELLTKLAEISAGLAEAERVGAEHAVRRATAEADATQAREQVQALDEHVAELEHEAARAAERLSVMEARLTEAQQRADDAAEQILAAQELNKSLEQRNVALDESVQEHREQVQARERELLEVTRAHAKLEREAQALRVARARDEEEVARARDSLRKIAIERDEINRQAAAFDGVAIKARERATHAEAASEASAAALRELETWRGELERRLASTTTELGAARAAAQANERERERLRGELAETEAVVELAQAEIKSLSARLQRSGERGTEPASTAQSADAERMAAELETLRAEAGATVAANEASQARIRALETERDEIAARAEQLAVMLAAPAEQPALGADAGEGGGASAEAQIERIRAGAEAEAREQAERELAEAAARAKFSASAE